MPPGMLLTPGVLLPVVLGLAVPFGLAELGPDWAVPFGLVELADGAVPFGLVVEPVLLGPVCVGADVEEAPDAPVPEELLLAPPDEPLLADPDEPPLAPPPEPPPPPAERAMLEALRSRMAAMDRDFMGHPLLRSLEINRRASVWFPDRSQVGRRRVQIH